jgi:preprotein translocase subunit SecB
MPGHDTALNVQELHQPPVTLTAHFFPTVAVRANEELNAEELASDAEFDYDYEFQVGLVQSEENPLDFQAELSIKTKEKEGCLKGYDIDLRVVGLFRLDESWPQEKREEALRILCPTMLYSSAREFLLSVTQRGPYPPVYLPTVSFQNLRDAEAPPGE